MKFIVSAVMTKVVPSESSGILLPGKGLNGSKRHEVPAPDISLHNVVGVVDAEDADQAWEKFSPHARMQHPDHKVAIRIIIQATEAQLEL